MLVSKESLTFRKARRCDTSLCPAGAIDGRRLITADLDASGNPVSPTRTVTSGELRFATAPVRGNNPEEVARRLLPQNVPFTKAQLDVFGTGVLYGEFTPPRQSARRTPHGVIR